MTKHTAIILLGIFVVVIALGGFTPGVRSALLVVSGLLVSVLAYLSSVVYCSNCKKLIEDAEQAFDGGAPKETTPHNPPRIQ